MSLVAFKGSNHRQQVRKRGALDHVDDRRTPSEVFDPLNDEFKFTLDAAASSENAKCRRFFTLQDDGLSKRWRGSVWCNPPYSDLWSWVDKAARSVRAGDCERVVMLLPANRCEQKWWQELVEPFRDGASNGKLRIRTRFLRGRHRFGWPTGRVVPIKGDRPPFGLVVVIIHGSNQRRISARAERANK